jgi:hypothetical protein
MQLDPVFSTSYQDATLAMVWLTEYYQKTHDVMIFSNQDKTLLAQLLAQPRRISDIDFHNITFYGLVAVACEWTVWRAPFRLIDVGKLFVTITRHAKEIPGVQFNPPVASWVFLTLFCMDSNLSVFPQLTLPLIFETFVTAIPKLELPLVQNVNSDVDVRINCSAWIHFLFLCYQTRFRELNLDVYDMNDCFTQIRDRLSAEINDFTIGKVKVRLANAFWLFRSMVAAQVGGRAPDPLAMSERESLYGFERAEVDKSRGRATLRMTSDVSFKFVEFHRSRDSSPKRKSNKH